MDQTQQLDWDGEDDSVEPSNGLGDSRQPVGRLHLLSSKYGPEKISALLLLVNHQNEETISISVESIDFWIYPGENIIGRLESCQVCLPASSVSKNHAVIEVPSLHGPHLLYDKGSLNRTRRQRMVLKPEIRYILQDGDALLFGDVGCQYFVLGPGGASESFDDSVEVPPTQIRPDASALAIEETPAPGRRMGLGGVLAQDSDKEEEGEDVVNGTFRKKGSDPVVQDGAGGPFKLASMFSSPSPAVVPESDEESEDASAGDLPCPSLRLSFGCQDAQPGSLEKREVMPLHQERLLVQPGEAETDVKAQPDLGGRSAETREASLDPPAVENFYLDSDTDMEENDGGGTLDPSIPRVLAEANKPLEVGSGTDEDEPLAVNPGADSQKNLQVVIDVGSDTDVEEGPDVSQTHQPDKSGEDDTDAEEGMANPSVAGPGSRESNPPKEDGFKDTRGPIDEQDVTHPKSHHLGGDEDSDTDVEEGTSSSAVRVEDQKPLENGDSDTDVDEPSLKTKNPEGTLKTPGAVHDSDGRTDEDDAPSCKVANASGPQKTSEAVEDSCDADVEMAELVLENSDVAQMHSPHPVSCKESNECMEETPLQGVVLQEKSDPGEGHKGTGVEAKYHHEAVSKPSLSLDGKNPLEDTRVVENPTASSQRPCLPILSVDSDTDVEEEAQSPGVGSKESCKAVDAGPGGGSSLENVGSGSPTPAGVGDSDTDLEVTSLSQKESGAQDSDTDVEEVTVPLPGKPLEEQGTQLFAPEGTSMAMGESAVSTTDVRARQGSCEKGNMVSPDGGSDTDDESDLAFQETQCFAPPETASPSRCEKAKDMTGAECSSPFQEEDQVSDAYMLEATQLFCKEPNSLSEEPTQAFVAQEEEGTQLVSQHPCGKGDLPGPQAASVVSALTSRGQQAMDVTWASSELVSQRATDGDIDKKKEDTKPVYSGQIPSSDNANLSDDLEERSSASAREACGAAKQVPDSTKPDLPPVSKRRRSLRLSSATSPPPASEGRSLRHCGRKGSASANETCKPATPLPRRRGLRHLSSPVQHMGEPEVKRVDPEEEKTSSRKKQPTAATRQIQRDSRATNRLKDEAATPASVPKTREQARRGKARSATEPIEEQQQMLSRTRTRAGKQSRNTSGSLPNPEALGKDARPRQDSPAVSTPSSRRRSQSQSTESKFGGTRSQQQKRTQGFGSPAPKVLFTGVIDEEGEHAVTTLGGSLAKSVFDCTHLVTDRVRRTVKFLCALARGIPIVTPDWLEKSRQNSFFLMPTSFFVHDPEQENNFGFSLIASLRKAQQGGGILQGYEIYVTLNVKPEPEHMRDIVKCSGGTFLPRMPRAYKDKRVVVSCPDDLTRCKPARDAGIPIASSEFILMGILQQEIDLDTYRLDRTGVSPLANPAAPTTRASKRRAVAQTAPAPPSTAKRRR